MANSLFPGGKFRQKENDCVRTVWWSDAVSWCDGFAMEKLSAPASSYSMRDKMATTDLPLLVRTTHTLAALRMVLPTVDERRCIIWSANRTNIMRYVPDAGMFANFVSHDHRLIFAAAAPGVFFALIRP